MREALPNLKEALQREELVLEALDEAYNQGKLEYLFYSPARDATGARAAALSFAVDRLEAAAAP